MWQHCMMKRREGTASGGALMLFSVGPCVRELSCRDQRYLQGPCDRTLGTPGGATEMNSNIACFFLILLLLKFMEAPLSKAVKQPLWQSSGPAISAVRTDTVAVWACPLPSPASLPRGCSCRQAATQTQSTCVGVSKARTGAFRPVPSLKGSHCSVWQ